MRVAANIVLTDEQKRELSIYARGRSVALRIVERANIILQAAEGKQDREIAADFNSAAILLRVGDPGFCSTACVESRRTRQGRAEPEPSTKKKSLGKQRRTSQPMQPIGQLGLWPVPLGSVRLPSGACGM